MWRASLTFIWSILSISQKYVQNCYFLCPASINERRQALGSWLKGDQVCTSVWSPSTSCPCCKSSPHQPQESRPPPSRVKTTNLKSQDHQPQESGHRPQPKHHRLICNFSMQWHISCRHKTTLNTLATSTTWTTWLPGPHWRPCPPGPPLPP